MCVSSQHSSSQRPPMAPLRGKAEVHSMAHKVLDLALITSLTHLSWSSPLLALSYHMGLCFCVGPPMPGELWPQGLCICSSLCWDILPLHSNFPYLFLISIPTSPHQFLSTIPSKTAIPALHSLSLLPPWPCHCHILSCTEHKLQENRSLTTVSPVPRTVLGMRRSRVHSQGMN